MTAQTMTACTGSAAHGRQAPVSNRLASLGRAIDGLRRRPSVDVKRALLVAGATGMGLGMVIIVLGWYGAAHSTYLFQEIPYLISGGLLGVALVAGGGFLFFAAWLVRMMEDNGRYAARVEQTLARVDRALDAITADAARAAAAGAAGTNGHDTDDDRPWRAQRSRPAETGARPGEGA